MRLAKASGNCSCSKPLFTYQINCCESLFSYEGRPHRCRVNENLPKFGHGMQFHTGPEWTRTDLVLLRQPSLNCQEHVHTGREFLAFPHPWTLLLYTQDAMTMMRRAKFIILYRCVEKERESTLRKTSTMIIKWAMLTTCTVET